MRRLCLVIGILVSLVAAAPASAATKAQARHAVKRELYWSHGITYPSISCTLLTSRRFSCHWWGLSDRDVSYGNVAGWRGTASVVYYGRNADVSLHVTQRGD